MKYSSITAKIVGTFLKKMYNRIKRDALYVMRYYSQYPILVDDYHKLLGIYSDKLWNLNNWVKEVDNIAKLQEFLKIYEKKYRLLKNTEINEFLYSDLVDLYEDFIIDLEKFIQNFSKEY